MASAYLEKFGQAVLDNGYAICAIRPGEKRPYGKDWEAQKFGPKTIAGFIEAGRGHFGVGLKTRRTPGVDIDCYDEEIVEHMIAFTTDMLGETLLRVGLPPKTLLVYRSKTAFPKTQSRTFVDDEGRLVKLEVLADGQQFVAFHVHPDTGKPYRWKDKRHPGNTPRSELPYITQDDALRLVEEFERLAKAKGWQIKSKKSLEQRSGDFDYDDPFITDKAKIELSAEEIRKKLDLVPDPDEHDHWFQVGMALFHQFDGGETGLQMWHEWSAQASNYDQDVLDERWKSFNVEGKRREPITARYILKHAKAEEERLAGEALDELKVEIEMATGYPAIRVVCDKVKREAFDPFQRDLLAKTIQEKLKKITGVGMAIGAVRNLVRYENPENTATPSWLEPYVYIQHTESFFNMKTGQSLTTKAFDQSYGRYMMTKQDRLEGKSAPEHAPSHAALHRYEIVTVANRMYLPGQPSIFEVDGVPYVNAFNEDTIPEAPATLNRQGRRMVDRFLRHMEHLFASERDRKLLLSWMAHIIQTNGRSNWCPVIQGVEGDGKTTIATVMAAMLGGHHNTVTINGDSLAEKYTPWAEGSLFCFVEEVRLHGADRYAVINKIKPFITNDTVPIRRMQTDIYDVLNTVNYMMGSNYKDAIPLGDNDSRYFPIFSRWQSKKKLEAFIAANPDYYGELAEIAAFGPELRRFFLDYELHPEFHPRKRAPHSAARVEMAALSRTPEEDALETMLEASDNPMLCDALLDSELLLEEADGTMPYGRALNTFLSEKGFALLGRFKIDGKMRRMWSQEPDRFRGPEDTDKMVAARIRRFVAAGGDAI